MKLLSRQEVTLATTSEELRARKELEATTVALREQEKKLNMLRDTSAALEKLERESHAERLAEMQHVQALLYGELVNLEKQKHDLMESVSVKRLQERENEVSRREASVVSRESFYSAWKDELESTQRASDEEQKLFARRKEKFSLQEQSVEKKLDELLTKERSLNLGLADIDRQRRDAAIREGALLDEVRQRLSEISMQEAALREMKKMLDEKQSVLTNQQKHLWSQQQALRAAFEEARKKNILS